jgi:hypothetical protein
MSKRTDRLNTRATELRALEHVAQIRLRNAERGLIDHGINDLPNVTNAFRAEVKAAREALNEIHEIQNQIIRDLDQHTTDFPNRAMLLVDDPNGLRIVERRDDDNTGTDETHWFDLGAPYDDHPMSFDTAIGVTSKNPGGYEFYRLYTQDEVDDLLDKALGL